ncbi:glycosyl transferase family 1 [Thermoanaerobacterium thermosaccharolyticum]|uniref:Glycosyl transferase family 1 n=1 Tax=Thermoanaerobacterium thermosaccharolyticum TaxID=1517 RepID=A0A223I1F0_THETR|nr:glycosyltransferase family 4 protein [Thermoanaerobacterium thermosaccharolyticum]AST58540.1 glycosyl transferase family 1 [Thermoanaerobacterium thermosaccharolyticum]
MKKILFVATVENHILYFHIPFIKYFQNKGYEVHVATKLGNMQNELKGISVICHNIDFSRSPYSLNNFKALKQLVNIMKRNKYLLVHVHTPVGAFLGRLAAKLTNTKPVIYTAHGFHFYKGGPLKNWIIYYTMEKIAAHWTDGIITINKEDFEYAKKFKIRVKNGVYIVHGVGVDIKKYYINNIKLRKDYRKRYLSATDNDVIIICIGEINKNKNQMQLIKSIQRILKEKNNVYALIIGDGSERKNLQKYIKDNELEKNIKILGFRSDIPELLNASDIIGLFSYREGLGKCLMEGMAAGLPIIATDTKGARELVNDGYNGFLVPVYDIDKTVDTIKKLADDKELRTKMGSEGRKIIQDYSIDKVLKEMDEIYSLYLNKTY